MMEFIYGLVGMVHCIGHVESEEKIVKRITMYS